MKGERKMYAKDALQCWGNYQGSQRKPADFDSFWEQSKKEVPTIDYQLEKIPFASKIVDAYQLTFQGVADGRIVCQFMRPKKIQGKHPALIQFHGYHTSAGELSDKVSLAAEGVFVFAMDVRGQGGVSIDSTKTTGGTLKGHIIRGVEEGPEHLFYRRVFIDTYQLAQIVFSMSAIDEERVSVYGVSQGGALALACGGLEPKISQAFVQYPFLSDYREAYRLDVTNSAYEELAYWFQFRDPLHQREEAFFKTLDYIDIQYFASNIQAKVVWGMGLADRICHPKTQFAVYNQLTTEKKLMTYPEYGHDYLPKYNDTVREKIVFKTCQEEN